jgi:tRNA A-37 threonylcarbamoyl transferase component Bud32
MAVPISTDVSVLPAVLGDHFRVLGVLGRGAIAEVVRAQDERTGKEVALKILYPHLRESAVVVERFRREVEIVRRIAHPNVLRIHDVVESEGRLFLAMDFHPGGDLADRMARRQRLDPAEMVHLARQLCGALSAAHRAGVVHRDVKPSNVLVGDGTQIDVRLCDFGLARMVEGAGLTLANAVLGTPEYMAPEVVTEGQADPRSDIYSLGVVLFEAATGKLPFYGDSPYQLMRQHVDLEAPRASSLMPDLPPALDAVIARALAKDPLDRFATADDLARALGEQQSLAARPAPGRPAPRRTCPACGGWLVEQAGACADCGARVTRLQWQRGGVDVLVEGPGEIADRIDAWKHVALCRLAEEVSPDTPSTARRGARAPRLPFYAARGLTEASALSLVERLKSIGLEASAPRASLLPAKKVRAKGGRLFVRYLALAGSLQAFTSFFEKMFVRIGAPAFLSIVAGVIALGIGAALRGAQPIIAKPGSRSLERPGQDLGRLLPTLASRQDRRLVARMIDRVDELGAHDRGDVAEPLAERAALAIRGLAALDEKRAADPVFEQDAERALVELRREERTRVVLRSDLLRTVSRLESASLVVARARTGASEEARDLGDQIADVASAVEIEEELKTFLAERR